jgi:short subunit dehydrogenase-like uncharacterized protein
MIGIVGATGFTGKLVASELHKRGAEFFIAGRNESALRALSEETGNVEWRLLDVQDSQTYDALNGCEVIINCAGPFLDYGEAIVKEAIKRSCHYLDLTGEQAFIKLVYDRYDADAKSANVCLIPACAFEYALGDAAGAILWKQLPDCTSIEFTYSMEGKNNTSAGTRKSIVRAIAANGYQLQDGKLIESAPASIHKRVTTSRKTAISFPGGEVLMLTKHTAIRNVTTFMAVEIAPAALKLVHLFGQSLVKYFGDFLVKNAGTKSPSNESREQTQFDISVTASGGSENRSMSIRGKDPYGLTAAIVSAAAIFIQQQIKLAKTIPTGALSPSMLAGPELIQSVSTEHAVTWTQGSSE